MTLAREYRRHGQPASPFRGETAFASTGVQPAPSLAPAHRQRASIWTIPSDAARLVTEPSIKYYSQG
ncbi:MAG: hypothetical protein MUC60_08185 [Oscillatoria sp. Prado101]|nr:hypothetical protein [Oscillatoria sp. Prado101]